MTLHEYLAEWVPQYAELLGLSRWDLDVTVKVVEEKASCEADPEYSWARLVFNPEKFSLDDREDIHRHIIHELMHCHVEWLGWIARELAEGDKFKLEVVRGMTEQLTKELELLLWGLLREEMLDGELE